MDLVDIFYTYDSHTDTVSCRIFPIGKVFHRLKWSGKLNDTTKVTSAIPVFPYYADEEDSDTVLIPMEIFRQHAP